MRRIALLTVAIFVVVGGLSAKTAFDLLRHRESFPFWFVPLFVAGLAALAGDAGFMTVRLWRAPEAAVPARGPSRAVIWVLLALSFVCTSAVHQFYPFRPSVAAVVGGLDAVLRFNLALTGFGFLATAALAALYLSGRRDGALLGLLAVDFLLLVPNDACANPFNEWWIAALGASPLMFVPNLYASLFAVAALLGIHPRWNTTALGATCLSVLLLGLGHMTRLIW